jgi:Protein of unknown function (DUF2442)
VNSREWEAPLDAETEAAIDAALERAKYAPTPAIAVSARFDVATNVLIVGLGNGRRLAIAREDLQGISDASAEDVARVEIVAFGTALHWEKLDVDYSVEGLIDGRTGNAKWMKQLNEQRRSDAAAALTRTA